MFAPLGRPLHAAIPTSWPRLPHFGALALALPVIASSAAAQVTLSGTISDASNGPLVPGTVYEVSGAVQVATGTTQTIQPGVILKFNFDASIVVNGTLLANGSGPGSIVCTDIRDDSVGGDTNGDGNATLPAPGWWRGILFQSGSGASLVNGITAQYGGRFGATFRLLSSNPALNTCRAIDSSNGGFDLSSSSYPVLANCGAFGCAQQAFRNVPLAAVPGFSGLTATGNAFDQLGVVAGDLPAGTTVSISTGNLLDNAMTMIGRISVPATSTLTFGPGCAVKHSFDGMVLVDGTLNLSGTPASPVVFSVDQDDTVGGDSNGDGSATSPAPGWWRGIALRPGSDGSVLENAELRYGGRFVPSVALDDTAPIIRNCIVRDGVNSGVDLNANALPTIQNLTVTNCTGRALSSVSLQAIPGLSGLSFNGNGFDQVQITSATVSAGESLTISPSNGFLDAFFLGTNLTIDPGGVLNIEAGTVMKMAFDRQWIIDGVLNLNGTGARRVILTSERDDAVGGDTNGDGGTSTGTPGWWRGVTLRDTSDGTDLRFANIQYAGRFQSAIEVNNSALTLSRCRIQDTSGPGLDMNTSTEACTIDSNRFIRCAQAAVTGVRLDRLPDIQFSAGEGNIRSTIEVTQATLATDTTIELENMFDGSVAILTNLVVPSGLELNLQSGVILKMFFDRVATIDGRLTVRASLENPVIITTVTDDSIGGDANGGGLVTVGGAGYWRGVTFTDGSDGSIVLGLDVRFGGRFQAAVVCNSDLTVIRDVRAFDSSSIGFRVEKHLVGLEGLVATDCGSDGIFLAGGTFDVRRCTSAGNAGSGIEAAPAYGGSVSDSILWMNAQGPEVGLGAARVTYSNGTASTANGNINLDPMFADLAGGDLGLLAGSPCINAGDPGSPLDPDSTRADMGAYFFNVCAPEVICTQPAAFAPCAPTMGLQGFASLTSSAPFNITLNGAPTQSFALFFYGVGSPTTVGAPFGDICVAAPYVRSGAFPSGGTFADGPCAGRFEFDFNTFLQSGGAPGVSAGDNVIGHFWFRYPASTLGAVFSDGVQIPVCP